MALMPRHLITLTNAGNFPVKLDEFLYAEIPRKLDKILGAGAASRSKIRRLIIAGAVSINGKQERIPAKMAPRGAEITILIDTEKFTFEKKPDDIAFEMTGDRILYEDESIIIVNKPAGIPTEATVVASRDHLHAALKRYLQTRDRTRNEPYIGLHHRLDRETSGVILFSKARSVNPACHEIFEGHLARKEYEALVAPMSRSSDRKKLTVGETFFVENELGRLSSKSAQAKWGAVSEGGSPARTDFEILALYPGAYKILAMPQTGRTHQIRVHLAEFGLPILGDPLYGGIESIAGREIPRVMLHARALAFPHPVTGVAMTVQAPIPRDFAELAAFLENT